MEIPEKITFLDHITLKKTDALLVIDMQNDFLPGGALAVENGDEIIPGINTLAEKFVSKNCRVVFTQDWHPPSHKSFASAHGKEPYAEYSTEAIGPVLWPDHCVQNTKGAEFSSELETRWAHLILRKGFNPEIDSYSGFMENDKKTTTGLAGYLKENAIKRVFICGLALDYCDYYTAVDARSEGFDVVFILDLTRGIDSPKGNVKKTLLDMDDRGVKFARSRVVNEL